MSGIGEVLDRGYRLEHRLQALVWTPGLRRVHQQKLIIRGLLDLDQVRHFADFLDVPEHLANALAARECLRHVAPLKLACRCRSSHAHARAGSPAGLLRASPTPLVIKPSPAAAPKLSWPLRMTFAP